MGSSPSTTNDSKGPVQVNVRHTRQDVNVKPTRRSQLRCKSPFQRPSSSLSISSKASFSHYGILPPVASSKDEICVERPTSESKERKTSRHTQSHKEGSVYLPDTRKPLPDIRNTSMSNAGSSDTMKTTHHRPSLQPLDSLRLMRENGSRRHRRNAGDLTQSGYNKSDLEIAVQASLAISEEQQSYGGKDKLSKHRVSELEIQTSEISERSSSQPLDSLRLMRENGPRRHHRNGGDLTQSGYNKSDLEIAVQASLAISEEQDEEWMAKNDEEGQEKSDDENEEDGMENCDPHIRNGDLTESGYDNRDLDVAVQMSLAISEELDEEWMVKEDEEGQEKSDDGNEEEGMENCDPDIRNGDLRESGYDNRDLDIAVQMSLAISEEQQYQQQEDEGFEEEDAGKRHNDGYKFTKSGYDEEELKRAIETSLAASSEVDQSNEDPSDKKKLNEENESVDSSKRDEEGTVDVIEEEQEESDAENYEDEEGVDDFDPDLSRSLEDILSEMRGTCNDYGYITLRIKRSCVWSSALEQFRQENFSPADGFEVIFVDDEGNEEGAIDAGGPKREYFQLMMDQLANCSLFEGPSGRKLLSYDVQANRRNEYFYAGMVIGQSLLYGGPVPRFLSPLLLDCLILEPENVTGSREDIYDSDWLQLLDEVQKTDSIRDFVLNHNKTMYIAGCLRNEKMDNKDQLIQDLINYYLVERTRPAFDTFKKGLDSVGVYEYIRTYPNQFRELFSRQEPLTAEKMSAIFTICHSYVCSEEEEDTFDEGESREDNDHDKMTKVEQKTAEFWKTYLRTVEAGGSLINLEDILMFTTGMKEQPYGQYPQIYFNHAYYDEPASKYPKSSTCSCELYLPLHETFEEFKEAMDFGILNGSQFGNA